jgi:hypothetical protein
LDDLYPPSNQRKNIYGSFPADFSMPAKPPRPALLSTLAAEYKKRSDKLKETRNGHNDRDWSERVIRQDFRKKNPSAKPEEVDTHCRKQRKTQIKNFREMEAKYFEYRDQVLVAGAQPLPIGNEAEHDMVIFGGSHPSDGSTSSEDAGTVRTRPRSGRSDDWIEAMMSQIPFGVTDIDETATASVVSVGGDPLPDTEIEPWESRSSAEIRVRAGPRLRGWQEKQSKNASNYETELLLGRS